MRLKKTRYNFIHIDYNSKQDSLSIKCPHSFEDRAIKTLSMFIQAFEISKSFIDKSFSLNICVDDFYLGKDVVMSYCKDATMTNVILIPDFCFMNWKESGMPDYEKICKQMISASHSKEVYDKLFWIGNTNTHFSRKRIIELAEEDERIEAYAMSWSLINGVNTPSKYVSLIDHTKYKYLIDIQGRGYSGRTKMLLFSGRTLFLVDRKWKEFFYDDLKPFLHYIPVKEDMSDLREKLDWADNNPDMAKKIAENAQKYAIEHLTRTNAINAFSSIIIDYVNKYGK